MRARWVGSRSIGKEDFGDGFGGGVDEREASAAISAIVVMIGSEEGILEGMAMC